MFYWIEVENEAKVADNLAYSIRFPLLTLFLFLFQVIALFSAPAAFAQQSQATSRKDLTPWRHREGSKIIGGQNAVISNWPGMVALRLHNLDNDQSIYLCGGTLISKYWVLTAAHCVYNSYQRRNGNYTRNLSDYSKVTNKIKFTGMGQLQVVAGTADLNQVKSNSIRSIRRIIVHQGYVKRHKELEAKFSTDAIIQCDHLGNDQCPWKTGDDIALIELRNGLELPLGILSPLERTDPPLFFRRLAYVAGYGLTKIDTGNDWQIYSPNQPGNSHFIAGSTLLQEAPVPMLRQEDCQRQRKGAEVGAGQICAWDKKKDTCSADSGGPLVRLDEDNAPYIIGLTSWGGGIKSACADPKPAVYTRISHYFKWIRSYVGDVPYIKLSRTEDHRGWKKTWRQMQKTLEEFKDIFGSDDKRIELKLCIGEKCERARKQQSFLKHEDQFHVLIKSQIPGRPFVVRLYPNGEAKPLLPLKRTIYSPKIVEKSWIKLPKIVVGNKLEDSSKGYPVQFKEDGGKLLVFVLPDSKKQFVEGLMSVWNNDNKSYLKKVAAMIASAMPKGAKRHAWSYRAFDLRVGY